MDTTEGNKLFSLNSANSFDQIINESEHILKNSSLCIDFIFIDQSNL